MNLKCYGGRSSITIQASDVIKFDRFSSQKWAGGFVGALEPDPEEEKEGDYIGIDEWILGSDRSVYVWQAVGGDPVEPEEITAEDPKTGLVVDREVVGQILRAIGERLGKYRFV